MPSVPGGIHPIHHRVNGPNQCPSGPKHDAIPIKLAHRCYPNWWHKQRRVWANKKETPLLPRPTGLALLSISMRPDVTMAVSLLRSHNKKPLKGPLKEAKYIDRCLKVTANYGLHFSSKGCPELEAFIHFPLPSNNDNIKLTAFCDANWGPQDASVQSEMNRQEVTINETRSVCRHLVMMNCNPVLWPVHKEGWNSRSYCKSEIKATDQCTKSLQHLHLIFGNFCLLINKPTKIANDN